MQNIITINQLIFFKQYIDSDPLFEQFCKALHLENYSDPLRKIDERVKIVLQMWAKDNAEKATLTALIKRMKGAQLYALSDCLENKKQKVAADNSKRLFILLCHRTGLVPVRIAQELQIDLAKGINERYDASQVNVHLLSMLDVAHDLVEILMPPTGNAEIPARRQPDTLQKMYEGENATIEFDNNTTGNEKAKKSQPKKGASTQELISYASMFMTVAESVLMGFNCDIGHCYFKRDVMSLLKLSDESKLNIFIVLDVASTDTISYINKEFLRESVILVRIDNAVPASIDFPRGTVSGSVFQNGFEDHPDEYFEVKYGHKIYNELHRPKFTAKVKKCIEFEMKELGYDEPDERQTKKATIVTKNNSLLVDDDEEPEDL